MTTTEPTAEVTSTNSAAPTLPVTGSNTAKKIAVWGAGILAAGALLFYISRRKRA